MINYFHLLIIFFVVSFVLFFFLYLYRKRGKKKYGIVMTCFNRPEYLSRTLESLKNSDLSDTIICIVDDHSSDINTQQLIHNFYVSNQSCEIIKLHNDINIGGCLSLRKGLEEIKDKCEYLCNVDSDVLVKYNWLKELESVNNASMHAFNKRMNITSGFNCTTTCLHKIVSEYPTFYTKQTIGGINMFFNQETYDNIINPVLSTNSRKWDWDICSKATYLECPITITKPSVIQHIGIHGMFSWGNNRYDYAEDF